MSRTYARVVEGRVAEAPFVIEAGSAPLAERFHPSIVATCVEVPASGAAGYGGPGGRSMFGPGGPAPSLNNPGLAATAPGGGGSGTAAWNNGVGIVGAAGAAGLCIIEEYA